MTAAPTLVRCLLMHAGFVCSDFVARAVYALDKKKPVLFLYSCILNSFRHFFQHYMRIPNGKSAAYCIVVLQHMKLRHLVLAATDTAMTCMQAEALLCMRSDASL